MLCNISAAWVHLNSVKGDIKIWQTLQSITMYLGGSKPSAEFTKDYFWEYERISDWKTDKGRELPK